MVALENLPLIRILLVEDSEIDAALLQRHLQKAGLGFELTRVSDGFEALSFLARRMIDIVITDFRLSGEDGLAIIQAIHERDPDLPCILVSGQVGEGIAVEALRAGARDFILKENLARLVPALVREHGETAQRRERRALEQALSRQAQFQQAILDNLPSPLFYKDRAGRYLGCNRAFEIAFGLSRDELKGKTVFEIMPRPMAEHFRAQDEALFSKPGIQSFQSRVKFADGKIHEVAFYKGTYQDGDFQGIVGTLVDLTNLTEVQQALRKSEDRYQKILQVAQEGILTTDKDLRVTYVNPSIERLCGEPSANLLNRQMDSLFSSDGLVSFQEKLSLRQLGGSEVSEKLISLQGEEERIVSVSATPMMDSGGHFEGLFAMLTDISERKRSELARQQMEIHLRHAQKLESIGQLAAGIAHEINTPTQYIGDNTVFLKDAFRNVLEFLSVLEAEVGNEALPDAGTLKSRIEALDLGYLKAEIPRAIQQSLEGVGRVSRIVSAMKDFSHPGSKDRERVDLNRAIESTITVSRNEWKYVATLETDLDPALPLVPCFPSEINQVVLNLLVNAAHAIEEANGGKDSGRMGLIRVSTRKEGEAIEIRISDTGSGIPKEIQSKIFDPFFTTKEVGKGTGQGLSIARAVIVNKHKGSIDLISEPGKGTVFILRLPLAEIP